MVEHLLTKTVGLTHLSFYAIAVNSVSEMPFRYTDQHLHRSIDILPVTKLIDHTQREGGQRAARRFIEEPINQFLADQTLLLGKRGSIALHLLYNNN